MKRGIIRDVLILALGYYTLKSFGILPNEIIIITIVLCALTIWFMLERIGLL